MDKIIGSVFLIAGVVSPMVAFSRAAGQAQATVSALIIASTLAGAVVGTCFLAVYLITDWHLMLDPAMYPWWLGFTGLGALIGVAGVLARLVRRA